MKDEVNVSVVQLDCAWLDRETNARRMAEFVETEAAEHGADLVIFPELASTGYVQPHLLDPDFTRRVYEQSESIPGPKSATLMITVFVSARRASTLTRAAASVRPYFTALLKRFCRQSIKARSSRRGYAERSCERHHARV